MEILRSIEYFSSAGLAEISLLGLFLILFFGTFLSEDAACLAAGTLASQGRITFAFAIVACFSGILAGDVALYWAGRLFGARLLNIGFVSRFVSEERIAKASEWLNTRGGSAVFMSRFITGLRLPTYLAAGALQTNFGKFIFYFVVASAIWTPILVGSAAFSTGVFSGNLLLGLILTFVLFRTAIKLSSRKNRRLFVGRLKRVVLWEFWPISVFYFPVVCYVLLLAVRHRSLTVFTCANPAILSGGFVGESKNDIYARLAASASADDFMLRHVLLRAAESSETNFAIVRKFMSENDLSYPIVLKPDKGERGKGVVILRTVEDLQKNLTTLGTDLILQEFVDGVEASIFYYRYPNEKNGQIFSITEKRFPELLGDGISDLETLILKDKRAVCLANSYFTQNRERLDQVPAPGEAVQIIDIGSHSRGTIFLDGAWLRTAELEKSIDDICREINGFYFGRFDLRAKSFDDLKRGKNFKIIELNGVTSESTNIYDPKFSLLDAYRILCSQWSIAFEIGNENRKLGAKPTSIRDLVRLIFGKEIAESTWQHSEPLITNN